MPDSQVLLHYELVFNHAETLITTNLALLVLTVGFVEKVFPKPKAKGLLALALITFLASLVAALVVQNLVSAAPIGLGWTTLPNVRTIAVYASDYGLAFGVCVMTLFALINLFSKENEKIESYVESEGYRE